MENGELKMDNRISNGMKFRYRTDKEMKDSGVEWIGKIPNEWLILKLRNLGNISTSSVDKKIEEKDKIVKLVNYVDIYNSKSKEIYNNSDYMKVSAKEKQIETCDLIKGDVLFTPSSETINDIGYSAVVMEDLDNTLYSYHIVRLRFNRYIYLNFKKYMFWSNSFLNYLSSRATGTTRKTLSLNDFKENTVVIPLKEEQEKIAKFLDVKTYEFDSIISKKEALIQKLEEAKKSLISEVVTGKVKVVKSADGYELVERKKEEMNECNESSIEFMPKDWIRKKLKYNCYLKGRIGWQGLKQSEFIDEGPYLITGMNFKNGKIRWEEVYHISEERYNEAPDIHLKAGDVLITKDGTIGKLLFIDYLPGKASLNSHLLVMRPLNNDFLPKFLYYSLDSSYFKEYVERVKTGTTFYGITQEAISNFNLLIPSINEQENIIAFLDHRLESLEKIISKIKREITLLKDAKQSLISEAVTGKIEILD